MAQGFLRKFIVSVVLTTTMLLGLGVKKAVDIAKPVIEAATPDIDEQDLEKFIQINGKVMTLPVGRDGINVLITDNFTQEQKEAIVEAIAELDEHLLYVDYNIYLDARKAPNKCITIDEVDTKAGKTGLAGLTYLPGIPYLMYPIEIMVDADKAMNYDNQLMKEQFKGTIKHELLHTLGLVDLYDDKYETESIMYFCSTPDSAKDLTQADIDLLNKVYSQEYVNCPVFASTNVGNPVLIETAKRKQAAPQDEMTM